jgi:predicted nucleic acid-binding protein
MNSWVFNTNVIVAAHLSPFGVPARLLSEVYARRLRMAYDFRILAEYQEVLGRKKFDPPPQAIKGFLQIVEDQERIAPLPLKTILPNPDDLMFLEVAAATSHRVLVTGNIKHYPQKSRGSVLVLTPAEALSLHLK